MNNIHTRHLPLCTAPVSSERVPLRTRAQQALLMGIAVVLFALYGTVSAQLALDAIVGDTFTFGADSVVEDAEFSWSLEQSGVPIGTQEGAFFRHVFDAPGAYTIVLTQKAPDGSGKTQRFPITVHPAVSVGPQQGGVLRAVVRTSPALVPNTGVRLPRNGGTVKFFFDESTGDIAEYRIDLDTQSDTDGDQIPNNDADNALHPSFTEGGTFSASFHPSDGETQRTVRVRVRDGDGRTSDADIQILFDPTLTLTPILRTFPRANGTSQVVPLAKEGGIVSFDATGSTGGARSFALDLDLNADSDADGNTENDNDAHGASFTRDGSPVAYYLEPQAGTMQREIALTVKDAAGRSAMLKRTIQFGDGSTTVTTPSTQAPAVGNQEIRADRTEIKIGEEFTLTVNAPAGAASYVWDFHGDGQSDATSTIPELTLRPDAPGTLPVRVTAQDSAGNDLQVFNGSFEVASEQTAPIDAPPSQAEWSTLRIDTVIQGLTVQLQPVLPAMENEPARTVSYLGIEPEWQFGDDSKSYLLTPQHTYDSAGSYAIALRLRDSETKSIVAATQETITVRQSAGTEPATGAESEEGFVASLLSGFGFIINVAALVFLFLLIIGVVFLFTLARRAKKEGKTLRDVIQEYRNNISGDIDAPLAKEGEQMPARAGTDGQQENAEIIDTEAVEETSDTVSDEIAPMRLTAHDTVMDAVEEAEEKVVQEPVGSSVDTPVEEPVLADAPATSSAEHAALPPWLAEDATTAPVDAAPPVEQQVAAPAPTAPEPALLDTPPAPQQGPAPDWLQEEPVATEVPPSTAAPPAEEVQPSTPAPLATEGPTPPWLATEEPAALPQVSEPKIASPIVEPPTEQQPEEPAVDTTPPWLAHAPSDVPASSAAPIPSAPEATAQEQPSTPPPDTTPAWLADTMDASPSENAQEEPSSASTESDPPVWKDIPRADAGNDETIAIVETEIPEEEGAESEEHTEEPPQNQAG